MMNRIQNPARRQAHFHSVLAIGTGTAISLICLCSTSASAQSMDYGSLDQLFGEPVTTSATGSPQRTTEVPVNMIIVTADEIRRSGARDIPGVLRHVGGVDVLQWASNDADVSIRGYDQAYAARTLVLIDGRQVYADFYGFVPWSALPVELSAIRQIEIVKGPNAALFGFNAVGGVINIITTNPRYDDVNTISARGGTQGLAELSGVATVKLGKIGALRLSGGLQSGNDFGAPLPTGGMGSSRMENDRAEIDANAVFALSDDVELDVEASHSHARRNEMTPGQSYGISRYETNSLLARFTADTGAGLLKFTAYHNWIAQWPGDASQFAGISFHNQITAVQGEDVFNLGTDHTFRVALEYRYNTVNTSPYIGANVFYGVVSASGMWNWRITPAISLISAVRFDRLSLGRNGSVPANYPFTNSDWDRKINEISFNSGLVWKADDQNTLRLSASRGVQLPSLANAGALVSDSGLFQITGVPTLRPTAVSNYELSWDRDVSLLAARLRASLFHQHSDDLIALTGGTIAIPGGAYSTSANIGDSDANGLELGANGLVGEDWRWSLSYRAEIIRDRFLPFAAGGMTLTDFEHTTPHHVAKAGLGWTQVDWEADAYLGYQSNTSGLQQAMSGTSLIPIGAYVSVDARAAYRLTDWATIAVSGQNLLQSPQRQTAGANVERQVFATLSVRY